MERNIKKRYDLLFLLLLIAIFLIIEISFIKYPGILCDEAGAPKTALIIKKGLSENSFTEAILKKRIPLMRFWHGALDAHILAFIFYLFPAGVVSIRLMAIFFGATTIFLTYCFTKEFFNKKYALLCILLLVINPGFIMGTKIGVEYGTIMSTIYMGILFFFLKWYRLKKNIYFCFAMFLLGLGMWTRIWFFWFVFGISLSAIIFKNDIKQRFEINRQTKLLKYIILGVLFFSLGCSPIIYNECTTNLSTVKYVLGGLRNPYAKEHNNLQYFRNLSVAMDNFREVLTGEFYFLQFQTHGNRFVNNLYPLILLISIIYLFVFAIFKKDFLYRKNILFLLILFIGMLILTPISQNHLPRFHFYFFNPLIQLIISVAVLNSIQYIKKFKITLIIIIIFFILFIVKELNGIRGYFYYLSKTGGKLHFSPAIYDLTDYLLKEKVSSVVVGSWGLHNVIDVCSDGRTSTEEYWWRTNIEGWRSHLLNKNKLFIFYSKEIVNLNSLEDFIKAAKQLNLKIVEKKRFYERDGSPIYIIMSQKENVDD